MGQTAFPVLETPRLILRRFRREDTPLFFRRLGGSETVSAHMLWVPHKDICESAASIEKTLARYDAGHCCRWAIALRESDALIGMIDLLAFDETSRSCSFAYMLGQDFWGQGYGTEALTAVLDHAFGRLGIRTVTSDHFADNPASGAVMRKAGMHYTRTIPGKYEKNGVRHDAVEYRITQAEWNARR